MKIAVNLTYLAGGEQPDGTGQFALNLFKSLQAIGKLNDFHLFVTTAFHQKCRGLFPEAKIIPIASMRQFGSVNKYHFFLQSLSINRCRLPHFLNKDRYDLLYHPFYEVDDYISEKIPTVITVHDLFFRNYPQGFNRNYLRYIKYRYENAIRQAAHIVAPSQFVRQDILKYYPNAQPDKITVVNNPMWIDADNTREYPLESPYILSVNAIREPKNLITLLKAFQLIEDKVEHHLVLTGAKRKVSIDPEQYAQRNNIKKLIITGYVSDEHRNYLYRNAALFISPSLHEGFGMTPVEAALCEVPVLTTRETSIPEITRNLVNYYEPARDHQILAERILDLLKNRPPQSELHRIKNTLAQEYDPQRIAARYYDVFQMMVSPDSR